MRPLRVHIISLLLLLTAALAQAQYGNEWIEYNLTYYKIKITKTGLYRIPYAAIDSLQGVSGPIQISGVNLYNMGDSVPMYIFDSNSNGNLESGDYIEFFGKGNDGSFDARLFSNPDAQQVNPEVSLFNDTAVYFLTWNSSNSNVLVSNIANDLTGTLPAKDPFFMHTVRQNYTDTFQFGKPTYVGGSPLAGGKPVYESIFDEGEGFTWPSFSLSTQGFLLIAPLPSSSATVDARVRCNIISISSSPHHLTLRMNTHQLADESFNNFRLTKFDTTMPVSALINYNEFFVTASGLGTVDRNAVAFVELTYPREFTLPNESKTKFTINAGAGTRYLEINAFNDRGTSPVLYDLTNYLRIVGTMGSNPLKFKLPTQPLNIPREMFLSSQHPSDITTVSSGSMETGRINFINYFNPANQGNYVILTHPVLRSGDDYVGEYAKYRGSAQGGNNVVEIVSIPQLYDQFAYGIQKHPLAIRNFIDFAVGNWNTKPDHLFIIGKGREYNVTRKDPYAYNQCLVPTFGNPGADNLLTATSASITPRVAVGRLSVENPLDIYYYLEKVKAYERLQSEKGDPHQTIAEKEWMKRVLHMGGGEGAAQQSQFRSYLESYEAIIEDTLYGGDVYSFYKTSTDPIQIVQSDFISDLINTGISLITFFGHSSPNSFDIAIDDPDNFSNFEHYHLVLSNGCFTGNIYNAAPGISEDFVLTPDKGAIGFISTISLSSSSALNVFSQQFYQNIGRAAYDSTIGTAMRKSVEYVESSANTTLNKSIAEEMTLHGDPGLRMNPHPKPDYVLEPQMVSIEPSTVSVEDNSFKIKVIVTNLGRAVDDSVNLIVTRFLPNPDDGSTSYVKRMRGTHFSDTVYFTIPTGTAKVFGLNTFCIKIDPENGAAGVCDGDGVGEIAELSETNNELSGLTLNITSDDVFPIHPYEFAVVPAQPVTLKASTANAFAGVKTYLMQIDTSELFISPMDSTAITQSGGVLTWTPAMTYDDSVVYYWRVKVDKPESAWHYSSFIYLNGEYPGWNQSHYYQYLKDQYSNVYLDNDRIFKFVDDTKTVTVKTGTADFRGGSLPDDQIAYHLNSGLKHRWNCGGSGGFDNGIVLAVFDSATGQNWLSKLSDVEYGDPCTGYRYNHVHGNIHCKNRDLEGFDFPTTSSCWMDKIVTFINSVPDGDYILAYSVNNAGYGNWTTDLKNTFISLGSTEVSDLVNYSYAPWAFFVKKGHPNTAVEMRGNGISDIINFTASFDAFWNQGTITTPLIGPAYEWGSVHWKHHARESSSYDKQSVDIIGVKQNGTETLLYSGLTVALDTSITFINANVFPYIRLLLDTRDDTTRTPTQLDYWRVLYKKVPEAALHPAFHFEFHGDNINLGEQLSLSVAVENVTEVHMDSLLVKYTLQSVGNTPVNNYVRFDSLRAYDTMNLDWLFNTDCNCIGDINTLIVEVNPVPQYSSGNVYDQLEQFHFNNIGVLTFGINKDRINPLLDVTFDGVHIMDGDIVSAEPEILIRLKDENRYLLLNDTSLVNVFIQNPEPDGQQIKLIYDGITMRFDKATGPDNTASIWLKKEFEQDGIYTLLVQAKDKSRNISGTYGIPQEGIDYRISFEVIREARLTNVLNYPNPFTSSTRFVFTLTGMQPPDFFKIQIMTISGKVVRELTQADLGPIHVGKNITEFAWDGTDEYGDPLANGLYLYRVVASIGGKPIEKMENSSVDKYFERGFGKMYLAR